MLARLNEVSDERVKVLGKIERDKLMVGQGKIVLGQRPCLEDDFARWV
jgi:hypothetical protein